MSHSSRLSAGRGSVASRAPRHGRVVPNLAVEVVSRTDSADHVVDKVAEYFHAGVERVWVVLPSQEHVYVY